MKLFETRSRHFFSPTKFATVFVFCLFVICFGTAQADDVSYDEIFLPLAGKAEGKNGLKVNWKVQQDIPGKVKNDGDDAAWLIVQSSLEGKALPALYQESDYLSMTSDLSFPLVDIADYNFDGHDDLKLIEGMSARGAYGAIFLYHPDKGRFEASENFSVLSLETVDKERKRLISLAHSSACENSEQEFIVKGFDQLELVFEQGTECPEDLLEKDQYRSFERRYENGKLVSEKTKIHQIDEDGASEDEGAEE